MANPSPETRASVVDQRRDMQQLALFEHYLQANDAHLEAIGTDTEYAKKFARQNALTACLEAGFDPVANRPDYTRCIAQGAPWLRQPYCGQRRRSMYFQSLDHAIENKSRFVPCPKCLDTARRQLTLP